MHVDRIADGLWRWTAPHPEWTPEAGPYGGWDRDVSCVYHEAADGIVLIDPLVPDALDESVRFWKHLDEDVARVGAPLTVVVSVAWHVRSAADVRERYPGARVLSATELPSCPVDALLTNGEILPGGVEAIVPSAPETMRMTMLHCACHGMLWTADFLLGGRDGDLAETPLSWFERDDEQAWMQQDLPVALREVADRKITVVIPAHGEPITSGAQDALRRASAA